MELIKIIGIAAVVLYVINDFLQNKTLLANRKMVVLAVFDSIFLIPIVFLLLTNYVDLVTYWWLIIIFGVPSLYYQFLKIKMSNGPILIELIRGGVTIALMVLVWTKV